MFGLSLEQLAILIAIALLILGARHISGGDNWSHLKNELRRHMPVFSAETTRGKEGEFIRDSLLKRFPFWLVLVAVVFVTATVWIVRAGSPP